MTSNFITKDELLAMGWEHRKIAAALDEADEYGPSGHWRNTTGKPLYDRDRVAVASYRIGLTNERPSGGQWAKWEKSEKPTSLPESTFDFHLLADKCSPGSWFEFRSLRRSHPIAGRFPGSWRKEDALIEEILLKLIAQESGVELQNQRDLECFLTDRSVLASQFFGTDWLKDIVVRPAMRASYVSKAVSKKAKQRFIDTISLIHAGLIQAAIERTINLNQFLISSPRFRLDRKILNVPHVDDV